MFCLKLFIIFFSIRHVYTVFLLPTRPFDERDMFITHIKFGYGLHDKMGDTEKDFIRAQTNVLISDAKLKSRQIAGVRNAHAKNVAFHVGTIMGKIREKYRNMLDLYREGQDLRHHRHLPRRVSFPNETVDSFFYYFELIRKYEVHIDHLVNVLEYIPEKEWAGDDGEISENMESTVRPYGRRSNQLDQFAYQKVIAEQKLKQNMRQKYLLKKMGRPLNASTSYKRFVREWPVVQTWDEYFAKMY